MLFAFIALALGGLLKGATGAGAPVVAVPVIAMLYDVRFAVAMLVVPNLITNLWQGWKYRRHMMPLPFTLRFAAAGMLGAGIGTVMLARLPSDALLALVAVAVFAYIAFRLARPDWTLAFGLARRVVLPVGAVAGVLQGAVGVSAPVSITFLNAMRPDRAAFVGTISVFFFAMSLSQIPLLAHYGILTWERLGWSMLALVPLMGFMPAGAALSRRVSKATFDRLILALLGLIALRLLYQALS